jgi:lipopolysaccharide biosynthesis glycosyltransferase
MRVCFAYVTDKKGFDLAALSIMSVAMSQPRPCHIQVFCYKFAPRPDSRLLEALTRLGAELRFSEIADDAVEQHPTHGHVTTPALLKLSAVARLMAAYDRIVYLDNDVLLFEDLKIAQLDFGAFPIGAVTDIDLTETGALRHSSWLDASSRDQATGSYFNSGVMIFESANWRGEFLETYAQVLQTHDHGCSYKLDCTSNDQCAANTAFRNNWLRLPATYNMQAGAKFTQSWRTAAARHYCGPRKCVPLQPFRSDGRDVAYLNRIRRMLGQPTSRLGLLYDVLFWINRVRHHRGDTAMRNFLAAHRAEFGAASVTGERLQGVQRVPQRSLV